MNISPDNQPNSWTSKPKITLLCSLGIVLVIVSCTSDAVLSTRLPQAPPHEKPSSKSTNGAGLAYFLPSGRIHITAARNDTLVTNYGLTKREFEPGRYVTNFITKVLVQTNIVTTIDTKSNFETVKFPPTLIYSNIATNPVSTSRSQTFSNNTIVSTPPNGTNYTNMVTSTTVSNIPGEGSISSTSVSNAPPTFYPTNSAYTNDTIAIITSEQPLVTTNFFYTVTITTDYAADYSNMFMLNPQLSGFYDDNITFATDNNGLLYTLSTSNTDQSGAVIVALAQTAAEAFELAAGGGPGSAAGGASGLGNVPSFEQMNVMEASLSNTTRLEKPADVSPTDDSDWEPIAAKLLQMNRALNLHVKPEMRFTLNAKLQTIHNQQKEMRDRKKSETEDQQNVRSLALKVAVTDLGASVVTALNQVIDGPPLNYDDFLQAGIALQPETKQLAMLFATPDPNDRFPMSQSYLNRRLLEDLFAGSLERLQIHPPIPPITLPPTPPQLIDVSFDPFDPIDVDRAAAWLQAGGLTIHLPDTAKKADHYKGWNDVSVTNASGVFYRPQIPYQVSISDQKKNVVSTTVLLPNKSPILHVDFKKSPLVTRVTQIQMINGFISSYAINKPSSVLAGVEIPLTIVSTLTSVLTNYIQLKFNIANSQASLTSAQLANQRAAISNAMLQIQLNASNAAAKAGTPPSGPVRLVR